MATGPAAEIDELFRLPLSEFTAARNALAKRAGKAGGDIRALPKPPLAAWAVNQLYWQDRDRYDDLIRAATEMRRTHKAVIEGKRGDLRSASREHDLALDAALKATIAIVETSGNPVTDATRQSIINTLRALPSPEPPGRLTRALVPGGFEMLAGISAAPSPKSAGPAAASARRAAPASDPAGSGGKGSAARKNEQEAARLREQRAAAERAIRDADRQARHAEFEAARAKRDATRAEHRLEQARQAFEEAKAELETAKQEATRTVDAMQLADRRSEEAHARLEQVRAQRLP